MFTPKAGYVAVRPLKVENTLGSGLKLPDSMTEKDANIGEVIECGLVPVIDGVKDWLDADLRPGDFVAYRPFTDTVVQQKLEKVSYVAYEQIVAFKKGVQNQSELN